MRLISLKISNFRVIKEASLLFPDKVIGIIGANGSGKSTIIEAIAWVLYGNQAARTGKDEIKATFASSNENCEVNLVFSINEEKYEVKRRLVGKTERAEVELYRGEASESVGLNETRTYVGQLLGLDWRGFLSSFLARQQELNALSDLPPAKRRDHIAGMLGIEQLDKAINKVKEDSKINQGKIRFRANDLIEKDTVEKQAVELTKTITEQAIPVKKQEKIYKSAQLLLKKITKEYEKIQQDRAKWLELKIRKEAEEQTAKDIIERINNLEQEKKTLIRAQADYEKYFEQLKELPLAKKQLKEQNEIKEQVTRRQELTKQKNEILAEIGKSEKQIELVDKNLKELSGKQKLIPENIEEQCQKEKQKLEKIREKYSRIRAEKNGIEKETGKLESQLELISKLGPDSVCERCHRPFGADYDNIKGHLKKELVQLEEEKGAKEAGLDSLKKKGEELRTKVQEMEKQVKSNYQLKVDVSSLHNELERKQNEIIKLQKKRDGFIAELDKYHNLNFNPEQYNSLNDKLEKLIKTEIEYNQLKGSLSRLPVVSETLIKLESKNEKVSKKITQLQKEMKSINYKENNFEQIKISFSDANNNFEDAKSKFQSLSQKKELLEKELNGKLEQLKSLDKKASELEELRASQYHMEKLGQLFSEFRKDLIASIRPTLAEISSRLFSEMTDSKYNLVELDEKYNLRVMDDGIYFGVDRFSGGEKDLANLCLRMAISLALTESAGMRRSFVILDEVFGSQDNQRKELILKALGRLKQRFPQILLVTHIEEIKDGVEEVIEVIPTGNGWSEVLVNGSRF